jgi:5'-3' exoribonuclease 2
MGVPAFFKWLTLRYPQVVCDAIEEVNSGYDINEFLKSKYDTNKSMPEIDNLYLDMNGIIHPCCHPTDRAQPDTEEEMFNAVFDYTDKLISIIKPKKLIYFAVDGVAPRAKMNQQRSRRFRAAQEAMEKKKKESELLSEWMSKGLQVPEKKDKKSFDSNVITPGTPFMEKLTKSLQFYISHRLQHSGLWKGVTVIFSDSSVPGEGEHKILEFIRLQRCK